MVNAYVFHLVVPHTLTTRYAGCVQGVCPGLNSCVAALGTRTSNRIDASLLVVSVFRGRQVDVFVPVMKVVLAYTTEMYSASMFFVISTSTSTLFEIRRR